mgnify:CR=1 FL=1
MNEFGPKLSIPIPIFCKIDMLRSIQSDIARRQIESLRKQQLLCWNSLLFHSSPQFFEENAFVRRVLIDEDETVRVFHQDIKFVEYADDLKLLRSGMPRTSGLPWRGRRQRPQLQIPLRSSGARRG